MNLSIVIPHYNDTQNLKKLLGRINNILGNTKFEIIIVDDNSSNFHKKEIISYLKNNKKINYFSFKKNYGPARARNIGVSKAKYGNILFLDSDVMVNKNTFKVFFKSINKYKVIVGLYNADDKVKSLGQCYKSNFEFFFQYKDGKVRNINFFHAAIAGIKKKIFLKAKGFDSKISYKMGFENEEFGLRLFRKYKIFLTPNLLVNHHRSSFYKILKDTFLRVSNWIIFNFKKKNEKKIFDSNVTTSQKMAFSCLNSFLTIFFLLSFFLTKIHIFIVLFTITLIIDLILFFKFYLFLIKRFNLKFPAFYICNMIYTTTVFLGSVLGIIKILFFSNKNI